MTPISMHFSLEEVTHSNIAARLGIDNDLPIELMPNVKQAACGLETVRAILNSNAIVVSSWYRCPALNTAVKSKPTSDHLTGYAIDFTCPTYGNPQEIVTAIVNSKIKFSQVIHEFDTWVHISFKGEQRQALVIDKDGTRIWTP